MDQRFQPTEEKHDRQVVDAMREHYCFFRQKYVVMKDSYTKTTMHYFTDKVIQSHLDGYYALGVFAGEKVTRFISFDVDAGGKPVVRKIMKTLVELGFPEDKIYVSTSGKKGYHVDMFFDPYIYNEKAKNIYDLVIWQAQLDPKKVEFRPTHTQAIKLPLGIHQKTGNRCWYLDPATLEPIEDMDYVFCIQHMDGQIIHDILRKWNKKHWNELYAEMICEASKPKTRKNPEYELAYDYRRKDEYFESHKLTEPGTRHDMMVRIATDIRYCGAGQQQIVKFLTGWYYRQDPMYIDSTEDEVREDIREIAEWVAESVPIIKEDKPPVQAKPITFDKYDINYILMGSTSAARRVALLIWTYCKLYGATHISYEKIASTVGCVEATAKTAIAELIKKKIIFKQSGGMHIVGGKMIRKSNTYFIPTRRDLACPADECLLADSYDYSEPYDKGKFYQYYCSVLGGICTDEYLAKFLTKPELADIQEMRKKNEEQGVHNQSETG